MTIPKNATVAVVIVLLVAIISYIVSSNLIASKQQLTTKVETVQQVSADLDYQDKAYFTPNAINPTKDIVVNENNNPTPVN